MSALHGDGGEEQVRGVHQQSVPTVKCFAINTQYGVTHYREIAVAHVHAPELLKWNGNGLTRFV